MPFWGRDWRGPGDQWLKTADGHWTKAKQCRDQLLESLNDDIMHRIIRRSLNEDESYANEYKEYMSDNQWQQPHFFVRKEATKEVGPRATLSEALLALNFKTALMDDRRCLYVCKILQILIKDKMNNLSGRTQIYLLELLQEAVKAVSRNGNFIGIARELMSDLRFSLKKNKYQHIGSDRLWQNHWEQLEDMERQLANLPEKEKKKKGSAGEAGLKFEELPPECLHRILSYVTAPEDLEKAKDVSGLLYSLIEDDLLWRRLVLFNFTQEQIKAVLPWRTRSIDDCNSKNIYRRLLKRFGDRHYYSSRLHYCEACKCLYWPILGHPCLPTPNIEKSSRDLSPQELIALFTM